jgi:hypothetical protein
MNRQKVNRIFEALMRSGFSMTTKEFYETTVRKILKKYCIDEKLNVEEYQELLGLILEQCAINTLKNLGLVYMDEDDWKDK